MLVFVCTYNREAHRLFCKSLSTASKQPVRIHFFGAMCMFGAYLRQFCLDFCKDTVSLMAAVTNVDQPATKVEKPAILTKFCELGKLMETLEIYE